MHNVNSYHIPVMVNEIIHYLEPVNRDIILDCTLGGGGHSVEIIDKILPDGLLIGLDQDDDAILAASNRLKSYSNTIIKKSSFAFIENILKELNIPKVDGVLFDLGVSSFQLDTPDRGFSFKADSKLDMRMNRSQDLTLEIVLNTFSSQALTDIIYKYGEEKWAKRIAEFIIKKREKGPIKYTNELFDIILAAVPAAARDSRINPATRTFQAFRIFINNEMESLENGLRAAINSLSKDGVICVLSYHSLEDRIVKNIFKEYTGRCTCPKDLPVCICNSMKELKILTGKPVVPSENEIMNNPRARSAKLRAAKRLV